MAAPAGSVRHAGWTLTVVCTAIFMLLLDLTVVVVALGDLQKEFHSSLDDLQWVIDAYTLALAGLLLTAATLGDRLGRRRVFMAGLVLFTAGSLGCALADSAGVLDATRAIQGVGGALLFGTALPLLGAAFPDPRRRASAIGAFGATLAAATAVGPLVGGILVDGPGWRWIFLVNVPIGIAALAVTILRLSESRPEHPRRADWPGTALLTGSLFALLLGLIRGNADGWGAPLIVGLFVAAGVLMAGFVVREATAAEPMLDLSLFASPAFSAVTFAGFAMGASLIAASTYLALYLLNTLEYSPLQAGLRFLPLTIASFVAAPVTARLSHRVPARLTVGGSLLLGTIGLVLIARVHGDSSWTALILGFVIGGIAMGISSTAISQAALSAVEPARAGMATGVVNTVRQVGIATGVAVLGAIFQSRATGQVTERLAGSGLPPRSISSLADAVGSGAGVRVAAALPAALPAALRERVASAAADATASGLDRAVLLGAVVAALAAVAGLVFVRPVTVTTPAVDAPQSAEHAGEATAPVG